MAAVQMNTRLDSDLKTRGDASFADAGYSPSEAVRLFWGFAARNRHNRRAMTDMIERLKDPREADKGLSTPNEDSWVMRGPALIQQYLRDYGASSADAPAWTPEEMDEVLADILEEDEARIRAEAIGLLSQASDRN